MSALAENPAVLDPRGALNRQQIAMLRAIDAAPYSTWRIRGGWRIGADNHRFTSLRPLVGLGLIAEDYFNGRHRLKVTGTGRLVLDRLANKPPRPAPAPASAPVEHRRAYWLDN